MFKDVEKEVMCKDKTSVVKKRNDRFPGIVIVIILAEFCERFSYSGMRAFLTLYLRSKLGFTDDEATEIYHLFSTLVYLFPIIGGVMADNYLGKFRTIVYMMIVYATGNLLVAVTAIPQLALPGRLCTALGLLMITLGTGGIKPCVTSFGGDQFKLPEQEHHLAVYFSILYFSLCTGSLIAKTVSPILRADVHCFGDKDCYSLAFGAPGLVVLIAIVIFVSAKNRYTMKKPEGNIVIDFLKCIALGLKNLALRRNENENHTHWLDSTRHQYDQRFIKDTKKILNLLMLFTVLPVFWALLDQMGSRWTLQATKMSGRLGMMTVKPDQVQVMGPIIILILIPLAQKYVYPFLENRNILKNPLHKLTLGGVLAGVAFIASASVEIYLKTTYPQLPTAGYSQMRIYNGNPCPISIYNPENFTHFTIQPYQLYTIKDIQVFGAKNVTLHMQGDCMREGQHELLLEENRAISFYLNGVEMYRFVENVEKSKSGFPILRFLVPSTINSTDLQFYNEGRQETEHFIKKGVSSQIEVFAGTYSVIFQNVTLMRNIEMESGGVYTAMINEDDGRFTVRVIAITEANSISMAWLVPQFLIMATAEVLFGVTGNEFAFKESPESMKAVMTAIWLLTEAAGNVIIIIITRVCAGCQQETQSFIYTGLIFASMLVFHYQARGYQFSEDVKKETRSNSQVLYLQVKQTEDCLEH